MDVIPHYINGKSRIETSQTSLILYNPANGEPIAKLYTATEQLINEAVEIAHQAQIQWQQVPAIKRAKVFRDFLKIIEAKEQELAEIVSLEHGKTIADAKASIARGMEIVAYHANIQQQLQGSFSHEVSTNVQTYTFRQPLGVCCGVTPFNFPVMVPLWMLMPALASGNAFIIKPSEKTPSASIKCIQWLEEAGLPTGLAQCLQGDKNTVDNLLKHPGIQAFTAVGSTHAAQHIYTTATAHGKRAHTFGGAKNHAIVMPDANLESCSDAIISSAFGSAGQRCMALSAIITIEQSTHQKLIPLLLKKMEKIKVGPGNDPQSDMGPVISQQQLLFLKEMILNCPAQGAKVLKDGSDLKIKSSPNGFYLGPTLIDKVTTSMDVYQKELFGPILIVLNTSCIQEAIQIINQNQYGNGAVIFTQNGATANKFIQNVQAGMVGINIPIPVPIVSHPFGGWKQSSFGDTAMHALESLNFYTKAKTVTMTWPDNQSSQINLNMPHH